ncbi:MAG TPA: glycerate kinase [Kiritimatiellia bacterium]|nr:glycerate kinase [Kiritimatiellia bacterium]
MNLLLVFDSFKGSLAAETACEIARQTLAHHSRPFTITSLPLGDGGEGTIYAILHALHGEWIPRNVHGPLPGQTVTAGYGLVPPASPSDAPTALIELATAAGLPLLESTQRNPLLTTTYGVGELIKQTLHHHPREILLAVGGSATVDGGTGAAAACGWRFIDRHGRDLQPCGGVLSAIHDLLPPPSAPPLPPLRILCDVTNPLLGPLGAAPVFAPQKGATPEHVQRLEDGLAHLAHIVHTRLGLNIASLPGGGAAGGFAAGATAWFGASLVSGIDTVLDLLPFHHACRHAHWLLTGEGSFDSQSLHGKVIDGLIRRARSINPTIRIAVLAGRIGLAETQWTAAGIDYAAPVTPRNMSLDEALRHAPALFAHAVRRWADQLPS